MKTADERVKEYLGDLIIQCAQAIADRDVLREENARLTARIAALEAECPSASGLRQDMGRYDPGDR